MACRELGIRITCCLMLGTAAPLSWAETIERVSFQDQGVARVVSGRILVEAEDGGLLLEGRDRRIWPLQPNQIESRRRDPDPFTYFSRSELAEQLLAELPEGFQVHDTAHYLICYNTSRAYAQWCGSLFERLHRAFVNFWKQQSLPIQGPELLVAVVFRDQASYLEYSRPELGEAAAAVIGFYSLGTNRITTYDLTGIERLRPSGNRAGSLKRVNQILARPEAERTVATVIHEATHQLAFNSGLQVRFADNPLWVSEGLAIYFETPDLSSSRGWRKIGALHPQRLQVLQRYLPQRPANSLMTLLTDDKRFRDTQQANEAYAESWALCYFLIRQRRDQFRMYLQKLGQKAPLGNDGAEARLREFQEAFGASWQEIDREFLRSLPTWR